MGTRSLRIDGGTVEMENRRGIDEGTVIVAETVVMIKGTGTMIDALLDHNVAPPPPPKERNTSLPNAIVATRRKTGRIHVMIYNGSDDISSIYVGFSPTSACNSSPQNCAGDDEAPGAASFKTSSAAGPRPSSSLPTARFWTPCRNGTSSRRRPSRGDAS